VSDGLASIVGIGKRFAAPLLALALLAGCNLVGCRRYRSPGPKACSHLRVPLDSWPVPSCKVPGEQIPVTFSCDQGRTLVPVTSPQGGTGIRAIVALEKPGALVAYGRTVNYLALFRSDDAGCSWAMIETQTAREGFPFSPTFVKGAGGRVYGHGLGPGSPSAFMIDGDRFTWMHRPGNEVRGFGADRQKPGHVRAADALGQLRDSVDFGDHWQIVGQPPPFVVPPLHRGLALHVHVAFDPSDLDHALFASSEVGSYLTRDGGRTWLQNGVSGHVAFSPLDGKVVWAYVKTGLVRSTDGGEHFESVVPGMGFEGRQAPDWIKADPGNVDAVFVHIGDFWRARLNFHYVDVARNIRDARHVDWQAFEPSPASPELWYVGLVGPPLPEY
jgi:hypothetical protein